MRKPRIVLDTNVWISGLLWTGRPHEILRVAERGHLVVVVSPAIVEEVAEALARPKFAARLATLRTSAQEILESLLSLAVDPRTFLKLWQAGRKFGGSAAGPGSSTRITRRRKR